MDKNQATGLILIFLLLMVYFQFFSEPTPVPPSPVTDSVITTAPQALPSEETPTVLEHSETPEAQQLSSKYGIYAPAAQGKEQEVVIENDDLLIKISTKGANVKEVMLKKHLTYDKRPLVLIDGRSSKISWKVPSPQGPVDLSDLFFKADQTSINLTEDDSASITFTANIGNGRSIIKTYNFQGTGYQLAAGIRFKGFDPSFGNENLVIEWENRIKKLEKDLETSRNNTTVNYYTSDHNFDYLTERSSELEEAQINQPIKWISFKQRFFNAALISSHGFQSGYVKTEVPNDTNTVKTALAVLTIPMSDLYNDKGDFTFYFGPNNYQICKKVTEGFSENVYLGWLLFAWFNKYLIIPIFNFLEKYIASYGIIIIILVVIIKIILSPLSYKSYVSMAKQKVLKPEIDKLKEKYGDDMQKMQQEQMKLFRQVGVNPLSGCIPLLLQMPILLAMFNFFPNSIELRQEGFLWADDLSTYDSILDLPFTIPFYGDHVSLFTILMTLSTILYTWSNNQMTTVQGPMKTVTYMMPVMFMFILNSFSSGLTFYYFMQNILTFVQQALIKKYLIDEDKIKEVLEENKRKNRNKKKSKFQMRLEQAMKASEENKKKKRR